MKIKFRGANFMRPKRAKIPVEKRIREWPLAEGDEVQIVGGDKEVGKRGKIVGLVSKLNSVLVENCKMAVKHVKPNPELPKGAKITKEMPIFHEHVRLIDPTTGTPSAVKLVRVFNPKTGKHELQRLSLTSQNLIPFPERKDPFKANAEGVMDTKPSIASQVTWKPSPLATANPPFPAPFLNELERLRRKNKESFAL